MSLLQATWDKLFAHWVLNKITRFDRRVTWIIIAYTHEEDNEHGQSAIRHILGLYSLSGKSSYYQISWSLEVARLDAIVTITLWNLTATSAPLLPRCLSNFKAIGKFQTQIFRLRDFTRSCGNMKTSYRLVNRGHEADADCPSCSFPPIFFLFVLSIICFNSRSPSAGSDIVTVGSHSMLDFPEEEL